MAMAEPMFLSDEDSQAPGNDLHSAYDIVSHCYKTVYCKSALKFKPFTLAYLISNESTSQPRHSKVER